MVEKRKATVIGTRERSPTIIPMPKYIARNTKSGDKDQTPELINNENYMSVKSLIDNNKKLKKESAT
jgi:hypothetical protein